MKTIKELAAAATTVRDRGYHGQSGARTASEQIETTEAGKPTKVRRNSKLHPEKVVIERQRKALISPDDIALRAWQLWQEEGCPSGKELEHWCRAEKELLEQ